MELEAIEQENNGLKVALPLFCCFLFSRPNVVLCSLQIQIDNADKTASVRRLTEEVEFLRSRMADLERQVGRRLHS